MATRRALARNNHLEEAMALLIRNQAAFVEQIARNDQERQSLREWQHKTQVWQDKTEERLAKIEVSLAELPQTILRSLLAQLPKAVKKEIGFTPRT
jgi:glycerol-3-phosphate dehydrogenase